ncbi:MAG TPA: lipase family protein [Corynebacterium pollutisoli]|uniref:Triacylglycerol lipase n=1 Tax=Corynebacterium pollutisoli TaxID=1610489 RepID=A0A7X8MW40_9CORY|nr:triacylglycerol lipase [Corynebacterium pollutisoli]HJD78246.1 lipase family protein [Corynebacterium pollutisoli]
MNGRRATRVHRAGVRSTVARAWVPLAHDVGRGVLRRLGGRGRSPERPTFAEWDAEPSFSDATWVIGQKPGTLLGTAPMRLMGGHRVTATRMEYVTTDARGRTITATGAYLHSHHQWRGGARPVVAFAPSTQGVAPHCDPSYSMSVGMAVTLRGPVDIVASYELPAITAMLAAGMHVVLTDYPRDPDFGWQLYCDHPSGGNALLDAVRAARHIGLPAAAPVGMWGFSQGGAAVGMALERGDYAPEVTPVAAVVGAPPSRLDEVLAHVDGSLVTGVLSYAVAGLMVASADIRAEILGALTPDGLDHFTADISTCAVSSVFTSGWRGTARWTHAGVPLGELLDDLPHVAAEFDARALGSRAPGVPVLLWGSRHDDVVPVAQVRDLRDEWRDRGGDVTWFEDRTFRIPGRTGANHFGPYYRHLTHHVGWLIDELRR